MKITTIVPVYNAAHTLPDCLRALAAQSRRSDQIIFVDNGSTDNSMSVIREFAAARPDLHILLLEEAKRGAGAARNRGLRSAEGEVIAFTDADAAPREDWLEKIDALYGEGAWDGIGGVYRFSDLRTTVARLQAVEMEIPEKFSGKAILDKRNCLWGQMLGTCNASYRKEVLEGLGGFDENFSVTGEDMDLTVRAVAAGRRILSWHPDVVVWHVPRKSILAHWIRIFEYRMALPALLKKHFPREAILDFPFAGVIRRPFPVSLAVTREFFFLAGLAFLAIFFSWRGWFWQALLAASVLFVLRFSRGLAKRAKRRGFVISPPEWLLLAAADTVQKFFSESGKIYGSLKHGAWFL